MQAPRWCTVDLRDGNQAVATLRCGAPQRSCRFAAGIDQPHEPREEAVNSNPCGRAAKLLPFVVQARCTCSKVAFIPPFVEAGLQRDRGACKLRSMFGFSSPQRSASLLQAKRTLTSFVAWLAMLRNASQGFARLRKASQGFRWLLLSFFQGHRCKGPPGVVERSEADI